LEPGWSCPKLRSETVTVVAVASFSASAAVAIAAMLLQPTVPPGSAAATAPRGQSTSPTDGRWPTTASDAPARLSAAGCRGPRDGSWFPCDRFAGRDTAQAPRELCGLRSLQPMDRSVSRDSATAKPPEAATRVRQTFENIRFKMIANIQEVRAVYLIPVRRGQIDVETRRLRSSRIDRRGH
jgi:hypothetical protein